MTASGWGNVSAGRLRIDLEMHLMPARDFKVA